MFKFQFQSEKTDWCAGLVWEEDSPVVVTDVTQFCKTCFNSVVFKVVKLVEVVVFFNFRN